MSRAYRIRVRESTSRVVTAEDRVSTRLEILGILPADEMAELLAAELEQRGFRREGGVMVRQEGALTITVDPRTGDVTVLARDAQEVALEAEREGRAFDDYGPDANKVRKQLQELAQKDLQKQAETETNRLQEELTNQLEGRLRDLRHELDQAVNRVTAEALKRKAAQMGEIKELTEDPETGSLTIVVEV
ncbi:MAG TPA: hypothetical protein VJ739_03445 [Gemmataceae bacterium]|nr:hypothetical protein [Gemmataceae bacterium]